MLLTTWNKQQTTGQRYSAAPTRKSNQKMETIKYQKVQYTNTLKQPIETKIDCSNWKTCQKWSFQNEMFQKKFAKFEKLDFRFKHALFACTVPFS